MPRIPEYRMQLRNILNRRSDFSEVSKQVGVSKEDLEALLELRSHIPMPSLQRLVDARGGEIAVRPEAFDDLSRESQWPAALANLRGKPLKTRNVQIQEGYEGIETVGTNLDLVDLAKWLIERVPPYIQCQKNCPAAGICPFAEPRTLWGPAQDRRCGLMANAIANYVVFLGSDLSTPARKFGDVFWSGHAASVS